MILLEKKVKLRPENTINFTENNTRVFSLESSTYTSTLLIRFSYRNFPPRNFGLFEQWKIHFYTGSWH